MTKPQQFVLGIAYQAGRDDRIRKGLDGKRDWFSADELEKAAWRFGAGPRDVGIEHGPSNTVGHINIVESYVYRGPDWQIGDTIVKAGDWLVGGICDDVAWNLVQTGRLNGWSPQGRGKRIAA